MNVDNFNALKHLFKKRPVQAILFLFSIFALWTANVYFSSYLSEMAKKHANQNPEMPKQSTGPTNKYEYEIANIQGDLIAGGTKIIQEAVKPETHYEDFNTLRIEIVENLESVETSLQIIEKELSILDTHAKSTLDPFTLKLNAWDKIKGYLDISSQSDAGLCNRILFENLLFMTRKITNYNNIIASRKTEIVATMPNLTAIKTIDEGILYELGMFKKMLPILIKQFQTPKSVTDKFILN